MTTPATEESVRSFGGSRKKSTSRRKYDGNLPSGVVERNGPIYVALSVAMVFSLSPIVAVLINSFRANSEIISEPLGLPNRFDVTNYVNAWVDASLGLYFLNSVIVTVASLALCLAFALPVAYALGRWTFRGKGALMVLFLVGLMVPLKIGVVPLTHLYERLGLMDSLLGLVFIWAAQGLPMAVLVLSAFYSQLPLSLEDAALVDGAGHGTIFLRVMTPLVRPAIAAVLVLNIAPSWNDFFMPLVFLKSEGKFTLPVGITSFFSEHTADRGLLYAGIIIAIIPVAIFFGFTMKQLVRGLTAGAEK